MLLDLREHPGQLFVLTTLLPLASFLLVFLSFGLWALFRRYRDDVNLGAVLYRVFGGDSPGRLPAFIAITAIAAAFVCSAAGCVMYFSELEEHREHDSKITELEKTIHGEANAGDRARLDEELKTEQTYSERFNQRWAGSVEWLRIRPYFTADAESATSLSVGYRIDTLNALMFAMVTFIATLIHLFSIGYMSEELQPIVEDHAIHTEDGHLHRRGRFGRFFLYLSLFCFSMLNLILADNLFQVFVSWELVGICSFLLIGFYYERHSASNAANKAFITNRVGDAGFILGLLILWTTVGTFNFEEIFHRIRAPEHDAPHEALAGQIVRGNLEQGEQQALRIDSKGTEVLLFPREAADHKHEAEAGEGEKAIPVAPRPAARQFGSMPYWMLVAAGLGIFLGCVGKSAQFPLQVWLPDAMEGPTPVSALIHAATMVAAGVYLVGRCYPLFAPEALLVISYTGGITLLIGASIAMVMTDIKKVLAYSTVSQLGYMMLGLGVGGWAAGLFHLLTHACFKALLFLGSGSVIHGCHHEQDMRKMGGLYPKMKITALTMLVGVLAISGVPLFSGWYSKDAILAAALTFVRAHPAHVLLFLLPLAGAGLTTFYMFRMWFLTFAGKPRDHHLHERSGESPWLMTVPLILLAVLSACAGWSVPQRETGSWIGWSWPLFDAEASLVGNAIEEAQPASVEADFAQDPHQVETNHSLAGYLALGMVAIGLLFASLLYLHGILDPNDALQQAPAVHDFLTNKWYFDELYSAVVVRPSLVVAHAFKWFDLTVIDGILHGVARSAVGVARFDRLFDNRIVDGLVNLIGSVVYSVGATLRSVQTGYLRSYVLFIVLATVGLFVALSYFVAVVLAA